MVCIDMAHLSITDTRRKRMQRAYVMSAMLMGLMAGTMVVMMWYHQAYAYYRLSKCRIKSKKEKRVEQMQDRATSAAAIDFAKAVEQMENIQPMDGGECTAFISQSSSYNEDEDEVNSVPQNVATTSSGSRSSKRKARTSVPTRKASKKAKPTQPSSTFESSFQALCRHFATHSMTTYFDSMAKVMEDENRRVEMRRDAMKIVIAELIQLKLPIGDLRKAVEILSKEPSHIDVFLNMPPEMKMAYVVNLLDQLRIVEE